MLKLGRVTKVKVLFLVLVFVSDFDLFKFSAAILEKGLFPTEEVPEDFSWSHFFCHSKLLHKLFIIILRNIIVLENFLLSFSQSWSRITMCNLHWCYTFCTGVTLFALVLHLNCTALSQSESSNFFMYIISTLIFTLHFNFWLRFGASSWPKRPCSDSGYNVKESVLSNYLATEPLKKRKAPDCG